MRKVFVFLVICSLLFSCNNGDKTPDVSGINVSLTTKRFEKDFFSLDTLNLDAGLTKLQNDYPEFFPDFMGKLLGIDAAMLKNGEAAKAIKLFYSTYHILYDSSQLLYADFSDYEQEIKTGLKYVKYYFPTYRLPSQIITFIAPLDASFETSFGLQGDILSNLFIGTGLQLHMGQNFSLYQTEQGQQLYPAYISNRFEPATIAVNCLKNIVDDLYPEKMDDKALVLQMVEKGKRLFVLSKLLPKTEEYKLIGYTNEQLKAVYGHEAAVWDLFVQNNFLRIIDKNIIKNYIGEGPKTQELGEASPGNIGSFAGWQIVKKFMGKNPEYTLQKLMETDAELIFQQAKYKP